MVKPVNDRKKPHLSVGTIGRVYYGSNIQPPFFYCTIWEEERRAGLFSTGQRDQAVNLRSCNFEDPNSSHSIQRLGHRENAKNL